MRIDLTEKQADWLYMMLNAMGEWVEDKDSRTYQNVLKKLEAKE